MLIKDGLTLSYYNSRLLILTLLFAYIFIGAKFTQSSYAKAMISDQEVMLTHIKYVKNKQILDILPIIDLRPLYESHHHSTIKMDLITKDLIHSMRKYTNLKINSSTDLIRLRKKNSILQKELTLAREFARSGVVAYQEVDLERAYSLLQSSLDLFRGSLLSFFHKEEVAQIYLTIALIALEQDKLLQASQAFSRALVHHPKLRLRKSLDGEKAYELFNSTLQQLRAYSTPELLTLVASYMPMHSNRSLLSLIMIKKELHIKVFHKKRYPTNSFNQILKKKPIFTITEPTDQFANSSKNRDEFLNRLASKIWFCFPFNIAMVPRSSKTPHMRLNVGWRNSMFIQAPVEIFQNIGFGSEFTWMAQSRLSWLVGFTWSSSNRDQQEDLRQDLTQGQLYIGPQWQSHVKGIRFLASLSLDIQYLNAITMTREVGCKHFTPSSYLPKTICQPQQDITELKTTLKIGPRMQLGVLFPLSSTLHLNLASYIATELYMYNDSPFRTPVGVLFSLGYHFNP